VGDQPVTWTLPTQNNTNIDKTQNTPMPGVGFEPTIPGLEWTKTFRALNCAATVIGYILLNSLFANHPIIRHYIISATANDFK
jgi:hypothetical protein